MPIEIDLETHRVGKGPVAPHPKSRRGKRPSALVRQRPVRRPIELPIRGLGWRKRPRPQGGGG